MSKQDEIDMSVRQFREGHPQSIIATLKQDIATQRTALEGLWGDYVSLSTEFAKITQKAMGVDYYTPPDDPELATLLQMVKNNDLDGYLAIIEKSQSVTEVDDADNAK